MKHQAGLNTAERIWVVIGEEEYVHARPVRMA
jgi:hypothetical protein